jgi:hypothetical protein
VTDSKIIEISQDEIAETVEQTISFRLRMEGVDIADPVERRRMGRQLETERQDREIADLSLEFIKTYEEMLSAMRIGFIVDVFGEDPDDPDSFSFRHSYSEEQIAESREESAQTYLALTQGTPLSCWLDCNESFNAAYAEFKQRSPSFLNFDLNKIKGSSEEGNLKLAFTRIVAGALLVFSSPQSVSDELEEVKLIPPFLPSAETQKQATKMLDFLKKDGIRSRTLEIALGSLSIGKLPSLDVDPVRFNQKPIELSRDARRDLLIRECDALSQGKLEFPQAKTKRFPSEIVEHIIGITGYPSLKGSSLKRKQRELEKGRFSNEFGENTYTYPRSLT